MAVTAVYARVSTDEQVEHGTSLDEQVRLCRLRAGDGSEVAEFVDAGVTGTNMDRPQLRALLERVRRHEIGRVIVYDPDRLSRNVTHLLLIVDELRRHGVELDFVNFQADLSPDGRLLFTVRGAISEFEAHRIKQRMYAGKQARARAGQVAAGTPIYGYRLVHGTWEEEPHEAQVVRLMFEWALDHGTWEIARRLNERGVPARFGGRWAQSSVLGILRNASYLGRMSQMRGLGSVPVPALVSETQFRRVQRALGGRRTRPQGRATHPYLLTEHLRCGVCGRSMCGGYGRANKSGYVTYYGCTAKSKASSSGGRCASRFWRSDRLDALVWTALVQWIQDAEACGEVLGGGQDAAPVLGELEAQQAALARQTERLEAERGRVVRAFRRALISEHDLARQQRELEAELGVLAERTRLLLARLRATRVPDTEGLRLAEIVAALVADVTGLEELDARRAVLAALRVRVIAGPGDRVLLRLGGED